MYESGQMHKLQTKWFPQFGKHHCDSLEIESLGINKVISVFVFILCMVPMCLLLLICELCYKHMKNVHVPIKWDRMEDNLEPEHDLRMDSSRPIIIKVNQTS